MKSLNPRPDAQSSKVVQTKSIGGNPTGTVQPQTAATSAAPAETASQPAVNYVMNFLDSVKAMTEGFAIINEDVFKKNQELAWSDRMSIDDRTISFECVDFLMSNLAYIFMGLVVDASFKKAFVDAVIFELKFDEAKEEDRKALRDKVKNPQKYDSIGSIIIGFTQFMPEIHKALEDKMAATFDRLDKYSNEFDEAVNALTYESKIELGMVFSNFMYLIRAFSHNDAFMSYVITVIESVKKSLR